MKRKNSMQMGEAQMLTLMQARSAIANPGYFARGGADVQEGRVSGVTVREEGGVLRYSGTVRGLWITLAGCYTETGEYDLAADALEKAYEILRYSENLEPTEQHYTSLFQNILTHIPGDCAKTYTISERELFVSHLTQEAFEPLKENARYAQLVRECTIHNA